MPAPAIVIAAHSRPQSLRRLLASLERAEIHTDTDLVISIDAGADETPAVVDVARAFDWRHGDLQVIEHERLGLIGNFHFCGDLTERFGSVVLLEDDLIVGPHFLHWATDALQSSDVDDRVAGVCLSAPWFDGFRHLPMEPILDGSDGFYAQIPWFHGMAWTERMWKGYRSGVDAASDVAIHPAFDSLGDDEWFPPAVRELVASGRYYLFPRAAHASNSGDAGTHFSDSSDFFQVPLSLGAPDRFSLLSLDDSLAVYDDHLELESSRLARYLGFMDDLAIDPTIDLTVDLLGMRDLAAVRSRLGAQALVLTTRPMKNPQRSWGSSLRPLVMNVIYDIAGDDIHLGRVDDVRTDRYANLVSRSTLRHHEKRGRLPGPKSFRDSTIDRLIRKSRRL